MVHLLATLGLPAALAAEWIVDGTSLAAVRGQEPVASHLSCPPPPDDARQLDGRALHTLGAAVVGYSKKQGTTTFGHASLRVVYCLDAELVDVEYEAYRLSAWNERQLRDEHASEDFASSEWLGSQRGQLVLFRNADPVDAGWYAEAQAANREIYEVWLDLSAEDLDQITLEVEAWHDAQLARLRRHEGLRRRFVAWGDNCTSVFDVLPDAIDVGSPITPFAWVRRLQRAGHVRARVLYPSHHLVRRWAGELPDTSRRRHPVFRRPKELPLSLVAQLHRAWLDAPPAVAGWLGASGEHPDEPARETFGIVRP